MKTSLKFLSVCVLVTATMFTSCAQKKVDMKRNRIHTVSINMMNSPADVSEGFWNATREGSTVHVGLVNSGRDGMFQINFSVDENEFTPTADGFKLEREAGVLAFEGDLPSDKGTGEFTFSVKSDFEDFLDDTVSGEADKNRDYYFFKLFLGDITRSYVNGLLRMNYEPTLRDLGKLGIHEVSLEYISAVRKMNFRDLDLEMISKWAIHGVSVEYVEQLSKMGYANIDANMVKKFAIHGISIDYIEGLSQVGYEKLDPNMVKNFAVHGISIDYIRRLSKAGYGNLEADMLKKFAVHGISPDYVSSLLAEDINKPDPNTIKKAKIHGVSANFIKRVRRAGHDTRELSEITKLKIRGV